MPVKPPMTDTEQIESLLLGQLSPAEAERLSTKLADDSRVAEVGESLQDDTLLSAVKGASTSIDPEAERLTERLVERLKPPAPVPVVGSVTMTAILSTDGPVLVDEGDPMPDTLEYFRIERVLGRGGMGTVYLADDTRLGRKVAVKTLKADVARKPGAKERFLREARLAAALEHECLVPIYYVGEAAGIPFLAMPLLKGQGLDEYLASHGGRLTIPDAVRVAGQIASGLAAAHAAGLIHRDIKPSNVWVDADRGGRVRILDFGLARSAMDDTNLTASGVIVGTPAYMAPEQARGRAVDGRADLFSLGVVMYQMLTGRRPFIGNDTVAILSSLALDIPAAPHTINPECPPHISELVMKLLEKEPAHRLQSAEAVLKALHPPAVVVVPQAWREAEQTEVIFADMAAPTPRAAKTPAKAKPARKFPVAAMVALAVLLVGGAAAAVYQFVFATKDGTLVVEVAEDADVRFKNGKLEVYDETGKKMYTLEPSDKSKVMPPGKYLVKVVGADGVKLDTDTFEMERKGKVVVKVTAAGPKDVAVVDPKKPDPVPPGVPGGSGLAVSTKTIAEAPNPGLDVTKPWTVETYFTPLTADLTTYASVCQVLGVSGEFHLGVTSGKCYGYSHHGETTGGTVTAGERVHLACVQTDKERRLFVNGKLVASVPNILQDANPKRNSLTFKVLSASEIESKVLVEGVRVSQAVRYTKDFTPAARHETDKQTLALYHCDEGSGDKLTDSSGHNRHGKITNAKWGKAAAAVGPANADRNAVEVALKHGFWAGIHVDGVERAYKTADDLPTSFQVTSFNCNRNKAATDETLECLRGLRHLKWAQITNCAATDKVLTYLAECKNLERLILYNSKITDAGLETLAGFKTLRSLDLTQLPLTEPAVKKLAAALPGCKIVWNGGEVGAAPLDPEWVKAVAAMPPEKQVEAVRAELEKRNPEFDGKAEHNRHVIEGDAVVELELDGKVIDIAPVRALPALKRLVVRKAAGPDNTIPLSDLSPLQGMKLTTLFVFKSQVKDVTPLKGMPIRDLVLAGAKVTDFSPLTGMPLENLELPDTAMADLTVLKGAKLKRLNLLDTQVTDLKPLIGMPLEELQCTNLVGDLTPLQGMKLKSLAVGHPVSDLTPLKGMPLENLQVYGLKLTDLSPIEGMPLKTLEYQLNLERDGKILRSLKSLETLNAKPAKDVLGGK